MDSVIACMLNVVVVAVPPFFNSSVEINIYCRFGTLFKPYSAAGQPKVGHFGLPAVYQLLTEYSQLIAYAVAHSRVTAG